MSLSPHHQNQLHLIQAGLLRSDPQLAARLSVFGRLCAGQAMPAWEQVSCRHDRIRQAAALIAETISVAAAGKIQLHRADHARVAPGASFAGLRSSLCGTAVPDTVHSASSHRRSGPRPEPPAAVARVGWTPPPWRKSTQFRGDALVRRSGRVT